jgi:hypothetical protein
VTPAGDALPVDLFVTAASDPKTRLTEYARITGFAELPPLWSFGYLQSHRVTVPWRSPARPRGRRRVCDRYDTPRWSGGAMYQNRPSKMKTVSERLKLPSC